MLVDELCLRLRRLREFCSFKNKQNLRRRFITESQVNLITHTSHDSLVIQSPTPYDDFPDQQQNYNSDNNERENETNLRNSEYAGVETQLIQKNVIKFTCATTFS